MNFMNYDYEEKYDAAQNQVTSQVCALSKDIIIDAYSDMVDYLQRKGELGPVAVETSIKLMVSSLWNVFVAEKQARSETAVKAIADKAAQDFGIVKLDPNKVIQ